MRAGTDFEIAIGLGHFQLLEEHIGHGTVVVLSGVHQGLANPGMRAQRAQDGSGFHEIRSGTDYVENVHWVFRQTRLYLVWG